MVLFILQLFLLHQDDEVTVNEVRPLREQSMCGVEVTHIAHGYGTIRNDVFFTLPACCHGYYPSIGDLVDAECVEYRHHHNNWRAYRITRQVDDRYGIEHGFR